MFLKIHHSLSEGDVVAVCDRELINTTISHGEMKLCITESFYGDQQVNEEEVRKVLARADNANIIGKRSIALAIDMGLISPSACIMIGDIPHAMIFRL
jgi:hypothetical protein